MTTKGRPELQELIAKLRHELRNFSPLTQGYWTYDNPNTSAHACLRDCLSALVTVEAQSDAPGRPVMDRVQELERDLEAMTAEARRNLQDRDAFWLRVEELEREVAWWKDSVEKITENQIPREAQQAKRIWELERELAALRAHPDLRAWEGIDTAPKYERVLIWSEKVQEIRIYKWGDYELYNEGRFTHWMPLPDPPDAALRSLEEGRLAQTEASAAPQEEK